MENYFSKNKEKFNDLKRKEWINSKLNEKRKKYLNDENLIKCPYNPLHKMKKKKLIHHISSKCKDKIEKGHLFETCPYNSLHIFKKEEIENHIKNCELREDPTKTENNFFLEIGKRFDSVQLKEDDFLNWGDPTKIENFGSKKKYEKFEIWGNSDDW